MTNRNRRLLANIFIGLGALLLLIVAGYLGYSQVSAERVRAELRAELSPTAVAPATQVAALPPTTLPTAAGSQLEPPALSGSTAGLRSGAPTPSSTREIELNSTAGTAGAKVASGADAVTAVATPTTKRSTPTRAGTATRRLASPTTTRTPSPAPTATALVGVEPARMTIPDLKVDSKVVPMTWRVVNTANGPVSEWVIPKNEAGHHVNSAKLGEVGNLVISGHNNIYGRVFLRISQAWDNTRRTKVDDFTDRSDILTGHSLVLYDAAGTAYPYVITDFLRVRDTGVSQEQRVKNGRFIQPTDTSEVTIVTCWPPTNNTHRLIVIAKPAP